MSLFKAMITSMTSWIWKKVDYDKAYWNQCVDWARQYAQDIGYPIGTFSGSALNGWKTGSPFKSNWKRVVYSAGKIPQKWAIVFFDKTKANPYGHVAVVHDAGERTITVVEQNAWSGNWDGKWANAIITRTYSYTNAPVGNVLGWYQLP